MPHKVWGVGLIKLPSPWWMQRSPSYRSVVAVLTSGSVRLWICYCLQVLASLSHIESCTTFAEFVKAFSQFGNEMVELAHLSGDRQNVRFFVFCISLLFFICPCSSSFFFSLLLSSLFLILLYSSSFFVVLLHSSLFFFFL